ncbi:COMM domain-containing protein 8-like [Ciona intestinalis]
MNGNEAASGHLKDFDWQLNLVLSSDKLSSLNQPLVKVDLDIQPDQKSPETKTTSIEMNKDELKILINALEGANKALEQAKS